MIAVESAQPHGATLQFAQPRSRQRWHMTMQPTSSTRSVASKGATAVLAVLVGVSLPGCGPGRETVPGPSDTRDGMPGHGSGMMMGGPGMMMGGPGMMGQSSIQRRRQAMATGIPAPYRDATDPLPSTPAVIAAGRDLYAANCAICHGTQGDGDGPAGAGLSPRPANLRSLVHSPMARDDYLMWAIGAGGAEFGTGMPAFKDALTEDARWKIIRYLRTL